MNNLRRSWIQVFFCLLVMTLLIEMSGGEEIITPAIVSDSSIQILDTVKNNGPTSVDNELVFTGSCTGKDTRLIVCRSSAGSCNIGTLPTSLLCISQKTNEEEKSCSYKSIEDDIGVHEQDIATCCDDQGNCAENAIAVEKWEVTTSLPIVKDDSLNVVPATFEEQNTKLTLSFVDQSITKLQFTLLKGSNIGLSQITRAIIPPEGIEFAKVYGLNLEEVSFVEATLYATAQGTSFYMCKFWDFELSTCVGSWEMIKPIEKNQEYSFNLVQGSFGFAEAIGIQQSPIPEPEQIIEQPIEETELIQSEQIVEPSINETSIEESILEIIIEGEITNNGPVEENQPITFQASCHSEQPARLILCKGNIICNLETLLESILCQSESSDSEQKNCTYITTENDVGENDDDIATCCTEENNCSKETKIIDLWTVNTIPTVPTELNITPEADVSNLTIEESEIIPDKIFDFDEVVEWNYTLEDIRKIKDGGRVFEGVHDYVIINNSE
ncbi:MAG: hypothetical protein Q8L34_05810, partial [Candidatus Woesearchaeota archaeon]|nr:hypothetical protein [Candidatus Woesearchaeota archaeon]